MKASCGHEVNLPDYIDLSRVKCAACIGIPDPSRYNPVDDRKCVDCNADLTGKGVRCPTCHAKHANKAKKRDDFNIKIAPSERNATAEVILGNYVPGGK